MIKKTVVVIPTYNEVENISLLLNQILSLKISGHELHALVVDDNSPDGTGNCVASLSQHTPQIQLMTRYKKRGRGLAGIDGFIHALKEGADYVIEMDADFSHDPKYIPALLQSVEKDADLAIGSRFIPGGADSDRGFLRRIITFFAGLYIRSFLNLKVHDASSGFRCFRRKVLEDIDLENFISTGPSIVQEVLYKATSRNFRVKEIPIIFIDRIRGKTKLDWITLLEVLIMVLRLRDLKKRGRLFVA